MCNYLILLRQIKILFNSTNQIQFSKEDKKLLFEKRHHLCSFTKPNYFLSCLRFSWQPHSVGCLRVYRVSLSEHYRNGSTYSFYFTWETIYLNGTASLAIRLAGGQNNLKILDNRKSKRHLNSCLTETAGRANTWWYKQAFIIIIFHGPRNYFA